MSRRRLSVGLDRRERIAGATPCRPYTVISGGDRRERIAGNTPSVTYTVIMDEVLA